MGPWSVALIFVGVVACLVALTGYLTLKCPKCGRLSLRRTGRTNIDTGPGLAAAVHLETFEIGCRHCGYSEWRRKSRRAHADSSGFGVSSGDHGNIHGDHGGSHGDSGGGGGGDGGG